MSQEVQTSTLENGRGFKRPLSLCLVTSNDSKADRFSEAMDIKTEASYPLFDEDRIKGEIEMAGVTNGVEYVAEISRRKLEMQRERQRELGTVDDELLLVSDSVLLVMTREGLRPANRDASQEEKDEALRLINQQGSVIFTGGMSFGRLKGGPALTVVSYFEAPLNQDLEHLPITIGELPDMVDGSGFRTGYVSFGVSMNGEPVPVLVDEKRTLDFSEARAYISGLTPEAIKFAREYAEIEREVGPIIESMVSDHPFNTLSFYTNIRRFGLGTKETFQKILERGKDYFAEFGGNCSFFTLALAEKLKQVVDKEPEVVMFPSWKPTKKKGHSGLIIQVQGRKFLCDPGLALTYPIPIDSAIPLAHMPLGGKKLSVAIRDVDGDKIPDVHIIRPNKSHTIMWGQEIMTLERLRFEAPELLTELQRGRELAKISYHDRGGREQIGVHLDLRNGHILVKGGSDIYMEGEMEEILSKSDQLIEICENKGVDPTLILNELNFMYNVGRE